MLNFNLTGFFRQTIAKFASPRKYQIFQFIPHQRVISQHQDTQEIFDLYQLGNFSRKLNNQFETHENIELVELQAQANYQPHYHAKSVATIYIIVGSGTFQLHEKYISYHPGQRIEVPAGVLHGFKTLTRTLFLSIQTPPIIDPLTGAIDIAYPFKEEHENIY